MTERAPHEPPFRLVVVDDSPLYRLRFAKLFSRGRDLTVVGVAADGHEAIRLAASAKPDVMLLDLTMPRMDGFAVLRWLMVHAPMPVVVFSSRSDRESVFKALELGAVDYIVKPTARDGLGKIESILIERVRAAARARVGGGHRVATSSFALPARAIAASAIAIGASTGGPAAIQRLVGMLPPSLTVPIVIAQHMPPGFTKLFAERLQRRSHYTAHEAPDGGRLEPGTISVAPGGMQTRIVAASDGPRIAVVPREGADMYAPSADALFESMSSVFGASTLAVVLTGMGDDGSGGVAAVKRAGGFVVAESSESALIFGMPRAAIATGCTDAQLPLDRMAEAFDALARTTKE